MRRISLTICFKHGIQGCPYLMLPLAGAQAVPCLDEGRGIGRDIELTLDVVGEDFPAALDGAGHQDVLVEDADIGGFGAEIDDEGRFGTVRRGGEKPP